MCESLKNSFPAISSYSLSNVPPVMKIRDALIIWQVHVAIVRHRPLAHRVAPRIVIHWRVGLLKETRFMPYEDLSLEFENKIAIVTLNRPKRRNALSLQLMLDLIDCLDEIEESRSIQAVILAAAGNVYCSGHDLSEMTGRTVSDYRRIFDVCANLMTKIQSIPQPVIAEVQGTATAAGCQLVATCDLAIAAEHASFATPGVRIGLFCTTPMVALSRAVGRKRALHMLLTGEAVDAPTAAQWGLINSVVPAAQLQAATRTLASRVAEASPLVVSIGKQAYYTQIDLDQPKAYAYAKEVMTTNALAGDAQEGISAFLEKRVACWSGK